MSLLREIQESAVDASTDLAVVLRKSAVLAARLGHEPLKRWVNQELNGYSSADDLPDYRILPVQSKGDFYGPSGSGYKNLPIPSSSLPPQYRDYVNKVFVTQGVGALEAIVTSPSGAPRVPWPTDLVALVGHDILEGMVCMNAWRTLPPNAIVGVLDTVRNRILSFVLEIEAQVPEAGEVETGEGPLLEERVSQVFNTYILGGTGHTIAPGGSIGSQTFHQVNVGDMASLKEYLIGLGIDTRDVQELEEAIKKDKSPTEPKRFGRKVANWIGKMTAKAASGAWNVATSAAADVLAKAISSYYGIGS